MEAQMRRCWTAISWRPMKEATRAYEGGFGNKAIGRQ